jgi:hypothetical protein
MELVGVEALPAAPKKIPAGRPHSQPINAPFFARDKPQAPVAQFDNLDFFINQIPKY